MEKAVGSPYTKTGGLLADLGLPCVSRRENIPVSGSFDCISRCRCLLHLGRCNHWQPPIAKKSNFAQLLFWIPGFGYHHQIKVSPCFCPAPSPICFGDHRTFVNMQQDQSPLALKHPKHLNAATAAEWGSGIHMKHSLPSKGSVWKTKKEPLKTKEKEVKRSHWG